MDLPTNLELGEELGRDICVYIHTSQLCAPVFD